MDSTSIITIHSYFTQYNTIVNIHLFHPKKLCATTSHGNVFSLYSGEGDGILLLAMRRHQIFSKVEASSTGALPVICIVCPACITKAQKIHISITRIPKTKVKSSTNITSYSFNNCNLGLFRICLIYCTNTSTVAYVKMTRVMRYRRLPIMLLYSVVPTLTPFSSLDSFNIVVMGFLKCLVVSRPNFFTRFQAFLLCEIKIPCSCCFTCKPRKNMSLPTILISNSCFIWLTNYYTLESEAEPNIISST